MRAVLALSLLSGCFIAGNPKDPEVPDDSGLPPGEGEGEPGEGEGEAPGWGATAPTITVDGESCALNWETSVGYCLESPSTFSVDGSADCALGLRATVWLPGDALSTGPDFALQEDSTTLGPGQGAVWVEKGGDTWTSTSGTATITDLGQWVSATFTGEFVDFINGDNPVSASATVWCERS